MTDTSNQIFQQKLRALRSGDEKLLERMGANKDVMSILREHLSIKWLRSLSLLSLVKANTSAAVEDRLPEDEVIAQMR